MDRDDLKILMIATELPPSFGGAAVQALCLARELREKGLIVEFVSDNGAEKSREDSLEDFSVYRLSTAGKRGKLRNLVFALKLFGFIAGSSSRYDIVHFHSANGYEIPFFPLFKLMKKKIVLKLTLAGSDDPLTLKRRKLGKVFFWGLGFVDKFIAISNRLVDLALESGIDRGKVELIPNGVDIEKFSATSADERSHLRKKLGFEAFDKLFFSAGKLEERKGYTFILESWKHISAKFPRAALLIGGPGNAGDNAYFTSLKEMIVSESLNNVFFLGMVDNIDEYMKISDCFLFASRLEGFGSVQIEALSSSVPVVSRNIEGITADIIRDEHIGRICRTESPSDFAHLAVSCLEDSDTEKRRKAADQIRSEFDIKRIAGKYMELYRTLMETS